MGRLLHGGIPYRDLWDHKPPGVYVIDAVALALGGDGPWSIWASSLVAAVVAIALAAVVLEEAFGREWGMLLGVLHATALVDPRLYQGGNLTEVYGLAFQWATLWGLTRDPRQLRPLWLAGVAAGVAATLKPTTSAIAIAAAIDLGIGGGPERPRAKALAAFSAGLILAPASGLLWLGWNDALSAARDCVLVYNQVYATPDLVGSVLHTIAACVKKDPVNLLAVLAFLSIPVRPAGPAALLGRLTLIALPFELIWLAVPDRFYGHYFLTLLPVLTVRAGVLISRVPARWSFAPARRRLLAAVIAGVLCVRLAVHVWRDHTDQQRGRAWQRAAVAAIQARAPVGDPVLVWGAELAVNFLADRRTPSLYGYAYPLLTPGYASEAMWQRFLSDLRRHAPRLIVDAADGRVVPRLDRLDADNIPPGVQPQMAEILERYQPVSPADDVRLWQLRARGTAPTG